MAQSPTRTRGFSPTLALCLALIGAASMLYYHQGLFMPRVVAVRASQGLGNGYSFGNDFYQVWLSARELMRQHRDPYSEEMTREIQTGLFGRPLDPNRPGDQTDRRVFPYPAFTDLLFSPASEFPFPVVRVVIVCMLAILILAAVSLWLHALEWRLQWQWIAVISLLTLCSYSALEGLFSAQLGLLVAFLLAAAVVALQRGRFLLAGVLLGVSTIKPQVTGLAILFLLIWSLRGWRTRGRFAIGFLATTAALTGAALAVLPHWIQSWVHTVLAYRHYTRPPLVTEVITSSLCPRLAEPAALVLTAVSIVVALRLAWRSRDAAATSFQVCITLAILLAITTIMILPGQAVYDHLILLPGILLLTRYQNEIRSAGPAARLLLITGAIVLFWPWMAAFVLVALRPLLPPAAYDSMAFFSLPIRTAASLPFAVLALLAWTGRIKFVKDRAAV
jgi:hypothetical protein